MNAFLTEALFPTVLNMSLTASAVILVVLLARFLPLLQDLRQSNSQTTQLLYALRPFLKEEKQPKVERAAKLAHLICIGKRFLTEGGLDIV